MNEASGGYSVDDGVFPAAGVAVRRGGPMRLRRELVAVRARTVEFARLLEAELGPAMPVPQHPGLNPPRWELGHVAWFQQWWIARNPDSRRGVHFDPARPRPPSDLPQADAWYDSSAVPHASRWSLPLPDLEDTLAWMASTQADTLARLEQLPEQAGDDELYFFRLVTLHEAMHVEAAIYMARQLGITLPAAREPAATLPPVQVLRVPAQAWTAGWIGDGFAFDNEVPARQVELEAFDIDSQPVSWSRFAGFVEAGGYDAPRWWSEEGWAWRRHTKTAQPVFPTDGGAAVHLSCHEAEAWCRWAGRRLPTEHEWECAALTQPGFGWGAAWEWTASPFEPHPGFVAHPYADYSQPWFGSRRVLKGASRATPGVLTHPRFRNFFTPERTDIVAGFRSCA